MSGDVLSRRVVRAALAAGAVVIAVASGASVVRLLPWLFAPAVPGTVGLAFARALAEMAVETALLVALPVGWALGASALVERGEARALHALGASPAGLALRTVPWAAAFAVAGAGVAAASGANASAPGRVARQLIEGGRRACEAADGRATAAVPLVDAVWLCFPGGPPRLLGTAARGAVVFSAAAAAPTDDLRGIDLDDAHILARGDATARLHVRRASVRGLVPWVPASGLPPAARGTLFGASGALLAFAAAAAVLRGRHDGRLAAAALGAAGPVAALATLAVLERSGAPAAAFAVVPAAGLGGLGTVAAIARFPRPRAR